MPGKICGAIPVPASKTVAVARNAAQRVLFRLAAAAFAMAAVTQAPAVRAAPFQCAPVLPSASRAPPYARVPGKELCEGYFEQTVSQPFIELLSLTRHRSDAPQLAAATVLHIRARAAAPLALTIRPLRPSPFYRVDGRLPPAGALEWNPAPMLTSTGLRMSDLGFLARAASPDPDLPLVAPLSLLPIADAEGLAYVVLRVSVPVASIAARQYRPGAVAGSWRELPGTPLLEWDTIVLPVTLAGAGTELRVDVRALGADGSLLPMLQFAVVGQ